MKISTNKTQELVFGPWGRNNLTPLKTGHGIIERVHQFKLLGVIAYIYRLDSYLDKKHIDYITTRTHQEMRQRT